MRGRIGQTLFQVVSYYHYISRHYLETGFVSLRNLTEKAYFFDSLANYICNKNPNSTMAEPHRRIFKTLVEKMKK
jgi:hypothetical protein